MPLYEYRCRRCGEVSEVLESLTTKERPTCEACGSRSMEKLLSTAAVHVKGQGGGRPDCGKETRCCGRAEPCDAPACSRD